ncbi:MAG: hypothetical protein JWO37_3507 [Acidimicrobiales bacterium]|jgi:hypothetical protein|nr:hypothetical protein [Acidimicrobiales bacterium]
MTIALAVLVALAAGVVIAAAAGARRTDTAMSRFLDTTDAGDAGFFGDEEHLDQVEALPQVDSATRFAFMGLAILDANGHIDRAKVANPIAFVHVPHQRAAHGPILVDGHRPDRQREDEVSINEFAARNLHLGIGSHLTFGAFGRDQTDDWLAGGVVEPRGPRVTVRVTGVVRSSDDVTTTAVPPDVLYMSRNNVLFTDAFFQRYRDEVANFGVASSVGLRRGTADYPAWERAAHTVAGPDAQVGPGSDERTSGKETERSTHLQAVGLWLFAGLAALASLLVLGQAIGFQMALDARDTSTLVALGFTRAQLIVTALLRPGVIALGGGAGALVVAMALSPLTQIGLARVAEVHPGFDVNVAVLGVGLVALITLIMLRAALTAWRVSSARGGSRHNIVARPSRAAERLASAGGSATAVAGVRAAFETGRRRGAVPAAPALAGVAIAIAAVTAAMTFGTSLQRFTTTPGLQGWSWDVAVGNPHTQTDIRDQAGPLLEQDPGVAEFAGITGEIGGELKADGAHVAVMGIAAAKGSVAPSMLEGRAPTTAGEVALGTTTLRDLHRHIGEDVTLEGDSAGGRFRIVGRALISPVVVNGQIRLGQGALLTLDGLHRISPDALVTQYLIRLRPGRDQGATLARMSAAFPGAVLKNIRPAEVENVWRVRALPTQLAAVLALLAAATLAHTLVTSVRARRRDLAVLKTIGFVHREVLSTVAWQAFVLTAIPIAVGLPLGIAGGRWAWTTLADRMGVAARPVVPVLAVLASVPAVLVVASVVAALAGRSAGRVRPALALRAE